MAPSLPEQKTKKITAFPVGPAGRRELRRALLTATDPGETIQSFQQAHSLHSMTARAFHTVPRHAAGEDDVAEPLDTDSVLTFLSHLGVSRHEVHRRVGDALRTQLEDEIRKVQGTETLLNLLKSCWSYSTSIPELRPVLWAVLRQLGAQTPLPVLELLGERDSTTGELKHADVWHPLPPLLKRLVWEADWDRRVGLKEPDDPKMYDDLLSSTLFGDQVLPAIKEYCSQSVLVDAANSTFVGSLRERRMVTTHRRAVASSRVTKDSSPSTDLSKPMSCLRKLLAGSETPAYRPKLLHALLSILMAKHGRSEGNSLVGGASHLHCTLVVDILLSGPLPKSYENLLALARTLDEAVKQGMITDVHVAQVQASLRGIYPSDSSTEPATQTKDVMSPSKSTSDSQGQVKGILDKIITSALMAMKEADPQSLFLNPVTDAVAPGYSQVIPEPMSIKQMESKIGQYRSLQEWERDVQLMFRNCINYNIGNEGQWFRGEARRQGKVFREDVFPQAKRHYQTAVIKQGGSGTVESHPKRTSEDVSSESTAEVVPLPASKFKKRKKDNQMISMPALAAMLLSDPFVIRLLLDRVLRSLRIDTSRGSSVPASHHVVPSLLQLLNIANGSVQLCKIQGKRFLVPDVGFLMPLDGEDENGSVPFKSLRQCMPLVVKLFLESELDRRLATGGDLHAAVRSLPDRDTRSTKELWGDMAQLSVVLSVVEGALVHVCQPGNSQDTSLAWTFPRFSVILEQANIWNERPFFLSLIQSILRHRSKLPRPVRDVVVSSWKNWLELGPPTRDLDQGCMTAAAHECFILLLNEWAALGNMLLPRDLLLKLSKETVEHVNSTEASEYRKFARMWNSQDGNIQELFQPIKDQYSRLLGYLTSEQSDAWTNELLKQEELSSDAAVDETSAKMISNAISEQAEEFTSTEA